MRTFLLLLFIPALISCNALGGIPDTTMNAIANAGGGCVKAQGIWGSGIIIIGNADKGVIRNGELTVAGDCGGISVKESAASKIAPLPPGSVTTITVPGTTTTTVTPK
jgi:hypothetical protein